MARLSNGQTVQEAEAQQVRQRIAYEDLCRVARAFLEGRASREQLAAQVTAVERLDPYKRP